MLPLSVSEIETCIPQSVTQTLLFTPTPPQGGFTRFLRDQTKAIRIVAWTPCAKPLFCGFCACVTGYGVNNNTQT